MLTTVTHSAFREALLRLSRPGLSYWRAPAPAGATAGGAGRGPRPWPEAPRRPAGRRQPERSRQDGKRDGTRKSPFVQGAAIWAVPVVLAIGTSAGAPPRSPYCHLEQSTSHAMLQIADLCVTLTCTPHPAHSPGVPHTTRPSNDPATAADQAESATHQPPPATWNRCTPSGACHGRRR
ncbi:hypothetical protein SCOCK_690009 [Actinacidiphila cocklensis]|uniref:Uncharacterized protein n=1 Tax=Actinacidiphila cocklensis TaxID=887465 RepID=A0A9W4GV72_9ACTN|nr:hypothetical protein SCOCK_690009 [Actinacidiphila cocklensis]